MNKSFDRETLYTKFKIYSDDIRYWLEKGKVNATFNISDEKLIIGGTDKKGRFTGVAAATYSGSITLLKKDSTKLIEEGKVQPTLFHLRDMDNLENLQTEYPFDIDTPNNYINNWRSDFLDKFNGSSLMARPYPKVIASPWHTLTSATKMFLSSRAKNEIDLDPIDDTLNKLAPKMLMQKKFITLKLTEMTLLESDLRNASLLPPAQKQSTRTCQA